VHCIALLINNITNYFVRSSNRAINSTISGNKIKSCYLFVIKCPLKHFLFKINTKKSKSIWGEDD